MERKKAYKEASQSTAIEENCSPFESRSVFLGGISLIAKKSCKVKQKRFKMGRLKDSEYNYTTMEVRVRMKEWR